MRAIETQRLSELSVTGSIAVGVIFIYNLHLNTHYAGYCRNCN